MNYSEFLYELQLSEIDEILLSINESFSFDGFKQKIISSLKNFKTKDKILKYVNDVIDRVVKYIKDDKKRKLFFSIIATIVLTYTSISALDFVGSVSNTYAKTTYEGEIVVNGRIDFMKKLAFKESSFVWDTVNQLGYMGLFQFGEQSLRDVGIHDVKSKDFKKNPNIFPIRNQIKAVSALIDKNIKYMRNFLHYDNKVIKGIKITKSGMVAAAHLVGASKVKRFLKSNGDIDPVDGNGKHCSDYIKEFAGYDLDKKDFYYKN